jgi:hypothetical protein
MLSKSRKLTRLLNIEDVKTAVRAQEWSKDTVIVVMSQAQAIDASVY